MNLQNMAPNAKRSLIVTIAFTGVAAAIWLFAMSPAEEALAKAREDLDFSTVKLETMRRNLSESSRATTRENELEEKMRPWREAMLEPLLGSRAMRAKSIVEQFALGAGLSDLEYEELQIRELPVTTPLPKQLYARCPIKITAQGSYAGIASFILRVEKELPYLTLGGLTVTAQSVPDIQKAVIILEWPTRGKETRP